MAHSSATTLKPRRRWLRFSLRTGFVLLTIFCVWLGMRVDRAQRQRRAVEWVKQHGGSVQYDEPDRFSRKDAVSGLQRLRTLIGKDFFTSVVRAEHIVSPDDGLARLGDLSELRILELGNVTDAAWARFPRLDKLETLGYGARPFISRVAIEHIKRIPTLRRLYLGIGCTNETLEHLAGAGTIEHLQIATGVSDAGLAYIQELPNLKSLHLCAAQRRITDAGLASLAGLQRLETLSINCNLTGDGLAHLTTLKQLRVLDVQSGELTDRGLEQVQKIPNLERFSFDIGHVTNEGRNKLVKARPTLKVSVRMW